MRDRTRHGHEPAPRSAAPRGASLTPPSAGVRFTDRLAPPHRERAPLQAKLAPVTEALLTAGPPPAPLPAATGGSPLDEATRGAMEAAFDADFAEVRVHRDGAAEAIGALAFTRGADIHFARGAYSPGSSRGRALLGHELAHVEQQRAGRVSASPGERVCCDPILEAEADRLGERAAAGEAAPIAGARGGAPSSSPSPPAAAPIQAKLQWSRRALEERSGKSNWFRSKAWGQLLRGLDRYHERSDETVADVPLLRRLQDAGITWIEEHGDEKATVRVKVKVGHAYDETLRGMVERLTYVDVPNEIGALISGLRGGVSEEKLEGGNVSDVSLTRFDRRVRVFKDELSDTSADVAYDSGIVENRAQHPLSGSRAVASWCVDQLISAGILTPTQFAQRLSEDKKQVGGTASVIAGGDSILHSNKYDIEKGENVSLHTFDEVDYTNPELQRQLSILQVLDVLTGQGDRHGGNFFVNSDSSAMTVSGIDNDASFGVLKTSIEYTKTDHSRGMPPFLDRDVGERLLALKPSQLRAELRELLPPNAIEASLVRLGRIQVALRTMASEGRLLRPSEWNAETSRAHTGDNSYLGRTRQQAAASKEEARFIPHGGDLSTKGRKARRERFVFLRRKLDRFDRRTTAIVEAARRGEEIVGFEAKTAPGLALELRTTIDALRDEFPGMGGERFFDKIEELIWRHLE